MGPARPSRGLSLTLAALAVVLSLSQAGCPAPADETAGAGPTPGGTTALPADPGWHPLLEGRWDVAARWDGGALLETHEPGSGGRWMVVEAAAGGSGPGRLSVGPVDLEPVPLEFRMSDRTFDYQVFRLWAAQGVVAIRDPGGICPDWYLGPDGHTAAFCVAPWGIWVADLAAPEPSAKLVTSETWQGKTRAELAASRPKGDSERGMTWAEFIGWSPDGRWIYYITGRDATGPAYWRVSPDGATEEQLGTLRGTPVRTPSGLISVEDPVWVPGKPTWAYPYGVFTASGRLFFVGEDGHLSLSAPSGDGQAAWDTGLEPYTFNLYRRFMTGCLSADGKVLLVGAKDVPGICFVTEDEHIFTWALPDSSPSSAGGTPSQAAGVSDWRTSSVGGWAPAGTRFAVPGPRGAYVVEVGPTGVSLVAAIPHPPFDPNGRYVLDVYWLDSNTLIVHVPPDVDHGNALPLELNPQTWIYVLPSGSGS